MSFYTDKNSFWLYFKDKLVFSLIATPSALSAVVHGLARYFGDIRCDILWLRDQFITTKSEHCHIPLHGDSRAVPRLRFDSNSTYRTRVEFAAVWHKLGGKENGLPKILEAYGFASGKVSNRRQENPAQWAHFDIKLLRPPQDFSEQDVLAVLAIANQYKPGRSVIGTIQFASQHKVPLCTGAAVQARLIVNHYAGAFESKPPVPVALSVGATSNAYITFRHGVKQS